MSETLRHWSYSAWKVFNYSNGLIAWNLFLAFIPLVLSLWLFRTRSHKPGWLWWGVFLVFIAFLPNAPYVLTDVIHLIQLIEYRLSVWLVTLILIPQYTLFLLLGFQAYAISLINLGYYIEKTKYKAYLPLIELTLHALCAIGIYLGRFQRYNSWDFITQPHAVVFSVFDNFTSKYPLLIMVITTGVLAGLYWIVKQADLGIAMRIKGNNRNLNGY
ncbi:MAG: hypothetical protein N5P05_001481 [Chroococcopsis gigantea SAG 12.99]|jgi:uncharacterized membrane protein|nr:DUF1361 domain-containing protein [Chlorogloea purpurea SAG 13.99]MDV2999875.1 hypothetical protein [Chroococcopsis gigantea SAG 12.99]